MKNTKELIADELSLRGELKKEAAGEKYGVFAYLSSGDTHLEDMDYFTDDYLDAKAHVREAEDILEENGATAYVEIWERDLEGLSGNTGAPLLHREVRSLINVVEANNKEVLAFIDTSWALDTEVKFAQLLNENREAIAADVSGESTREYLREIASINTDELNDNISGEFLKRLASLTKTAVSQQDAFDALNAAWEVADTLGASNGADKSTLGFAAEHIKKHLNVIDEYLMTHE